jgi:hypothetical protein
VEGVPERSDPDLDRLFQLPLAEFTRARNALATELAKRGRTDESEGVRALVKPPVSAWTVNQLHWRHRKDLDALLDVGERIRTAQAAQLAGRDAGDIRPLLDARRDASARLTSHAAAILSEAGHQPAPAMLRRVTTTLEALAAYGDSAEGPRAGHLTADVDAPGFDALAGLVSGGPGRATSRQTARVMPLRRPEPAPAPATSARHGGANDAAAARRAAAQRARQAEAREAVRNAQAAVRDARRAESDAKASLEKAATRARTAAREKEAAEQEYERARTAADEAARDAHRLARDVERAAKVVTEAERALERAEADEARLRSP